MKTARIISEEDIVPNRAAGYRLDKGALKKQEWVSPTFNSTADGSLYFSVLDVIAWDKGLRSGAILSSRSWEQVYDPVKLKSGNRYPYGFGWFVDTLNGNLRLHHSGSWQGFKSYMLRDRIADRNDRTCSRRKSLALHDPVEIAAADRLTPRCSRQSARIGFV